tara:strand:- start:1437 stop:1664 length:228 start_codon:yes stop_codon:yes gene_type:complete
MHTPQGLGFVDTEVVVNVSVEFLIGHVSKAVADVLTDHVMQIGVGYSVEGTIDVSFDFVVTLLLGHLALRHFAWG